MISFVCKNLSCLILKHTVSGSPVSVHFFSTSTATKLGINPALFDILKHKYDFPSELATRVASELSRLKNPEKIDSILSFFKESGFSNAQLERTVKYKPRILAGSLEGIIKPKLKFFQELGFSSDDIPRIISIAPTILELSLNNNIIPSISVLKGLSGSNDEMVRVIRKAPRILTANLGNTVLPNIEFLKSCGVPEERMHIIFSRHPGCFMIKPQVMRKCADKAKEMGITASSTNFIYAIPALANMSNEFLENKLQAFRDLGFSDSDIWTMFRKTPLTFLTSMEKVKKLTELLLGTGKFKLSCIVNYPYSLTSSVEKRYKPRFQVLGILESKNLIEHWPCLGTICVLTDDKFYKKFIRPCLNEVRDFDIIKNFTREKKEMR